MSNRNGPAVALLLGTSLIAACGGGSGDSANDRVPLPVAPALSLTLQPIKTFSFAWDAVEGATEYRLLENADGGSGYSEVATIDNGATSLDLQAFLPGRVNASYILQACNSAGCTDSPPVFVTGNLVEAVGYVKASNTGSSNEFGSAVALSADGTTLAVGAPAEFGAFGGGAVYVFARSGLTWSQQAYIKGSNTSLGDQFGVALALSADGGTLAVGADYEDSSATGINGDQQNNGAANSGAVYVFTRHDGDWSQQAYVKASNTSATARFGFALDLSHDGHTLAVGAYMDSRGSTGINGDEQANGFSFSGSAYVFTRNGAGWSQEAYIKASNTGRNDGFGYAVALAADGNTLAVGAPQEDSNATGINGDQTNDDAPTSGAVYVFTRSGTDWTQQAYIKASNTGRGDNFGFSIALSADGDTLASSAFLEDSNATGIDGDQGNDVANNSGAVYVFIRDDMGWFQQSYIKASNTGAENRFGFAIDLSHDGNTLVVGADYENSNAAGINGDQYNNTAETSGAAYVFSRSGMTWTQLAYVKASNTGGTDDRFGGAIALSGDGMTLAVGARFEDSSATGINGDQKNSNATNSGAVYLY